MGVICLIHGDANDRSGKQSGDDVDCRMTNEQLIELHVRQELEKHRHRMERVDSKSQTRHFPSNSMGKTLNGMTRVKKMTSISILTLAIQPTVAKAPLWKMHSHYTRRNKHCRVPTNSWHTLQNTTLEWAFPWLTLKPLPKMRHNEHHIHWQSGLDAAMYSYHWQFRKLSCPTLDEGRHDTHHAYRVWTPPRSCQPRIWYQSWWIERQRQLLCTPIPVGW